MGVSIEVMDGVAIADADDKLPYNHVITVVDRRLEVDDDELVQNNIATDTFTLELDGEWDGISPVVIFKASAESCDNAYEVAYHGDPANIPAEVMQNIGAVDVSVMGYDSTGNVRIVTVDAPGCMSVVKSGCYDGTDPAEATPSLLGQIIAAGDKANQAGDYANEKGDYAAKAGDEASAAAEEATAQASSAQSAADAANTAAGNANEQATRAENAANLLTDNFLKGTLGPAEVLTADDTYPQTPLGLKVYGNTRQNLWVNPSGTNSGLSASKNDDGTVTIAGENGSDSIKTISLTSYNVKPNTKYFLSIDASIPDADSNTCFFVTERDAENVFILQHNVGNDVNDLSFTTASNTSFISCGVQANAGKTLSGTYRVMLNEGETAEPWCPPGLNSVSEVSAVLAGKNLSMYSDISVGSTNNIVITKQLLPGTYTVSCEKDDTVYFGLNQETIDGKQIVGPYVKYPYTFTIDDTTSLFCNAFGTGSVSNLQIELGSTATEYEPPNVNTVPIGLQGSELCSIEKKGIRDELDIVSGSVMKLIDDVLISNIDYEPLETDTFQYAAVTPENLPIDGDMHFLCNNFRVGMKEPGGVYVAGGSNAAFFFCFELGTFSSQEEAEAWFAANPTRVVYETQKQRTIQLTPPELPALPAPNLTAYADADVTCDMGLEYAHDVNIVVGRIEQAIEGLGA